MLRSKQKESETDKQIKMENVVIETEKGEQNDEI